MHAINEQLFLWINASANPPAATLTLAHLLAEWLVYTVPCLLVGLWLWGQRAQRSAALTAALGILVALACNQLITLLWPQPRPFMLGLGHTFLAHKAEASFPSDHATLFFSLGFAFIFCRQSLVGALILMVGVAVGWARVYLGVHFPFDIAGALPVALVSVWITYRVLQSRLGLDLFERLLALYRRILQPFITKGWIQT